MNKQKLVAFMVIAIGTFMGSGVRADIGDIAYGKVKALVATGHNSGNTAGTISNPEGRGDLLIFPYYDVREINGKAQDFYFTIINDESECESLAGYPNVECNAGMAVRIRFREGVRGEKVLNFDSWLSRGDVWVGMVTHNTSLALPYGARIFSPDWVIVDYNADAFTVDKPLASGLDFPAQIYMSPESNNLVGFFEVIGEERTFDHQSSGKVTRLTENEDAPNSLMGYGYIVRVADGSSFAYNATAIANFSRTKGSLFSSPGSLSPTLLDCEDTLDQLEFQLSKKEVLAGYSVENVIGGKFSLILTFPTKHFHFCGKPNYTIKGDPTAPCTTDYPTGSPFKGAKGYYYGGSSVAEPVDLGIFDRDEHKLSLPVLCFLGTCPPQLEPGLPWGLNLIGLYQTPPAVPQLNNRDNVAFPTYDGSQLFDKGYIRINFLSTGQVQSLNPKVSQFLHFDMPFDAYEGLPVIGVALQEYSNYNVGGFYGDTRDVFYKTKLITK
jgi:hypothetical protein